MGALLFTIVDVASNSIAGIAFIHVPATKGAILETPEKSLIRRIMKCRMRAY